MFDEIRRQSKSTGTYILVGLLIVIFAVFFGGPVGECGDSALRFKVAKVGKTDIFNEDIRLVYNRVYRGQRNITEEAYNQQQADSLRHLIIINLLADRALDLDLRVSDDELKAYINDPLRNREYSAYHQNGAFSGNYYKNYVRNGLETSPSDYEKFKRRELLAAKYIDLLQMQGAATPAEIEQQAKLKFSKVNLDFIKIDPATLDEHIKVSDAMISSFEQTKAADVKNYYASHLADYTKPARISVRRIFINVPDDSEGDDKKEEAETAWKAAQKRILEDNEDFATVAKELSQDVAKDNGGLIDWTDVDNLDQDIVNAVKDAKVGDIKVVSTGNAHNLVKLEGYEKEEVTPFESVQKEIATKLAKESQVASLVAELVSEFQTALEEKGTLEDALKSLQAEPEEVPTKGAKAKEAAPEDDHDHAKIWQSISVEETGDFTQNGKDLSSMFGGQFAGLALNSPWDDVPKVGRSPEVVREAFALTGDEKNFKAPVVVDGKTFIFQLKERIEPTEQELKDNAIGTEIASNAIAPFVPPVQGEFIVFAPLPSYGAIIDQLYFEGIEKKNITFKNAKRWAPHAFLVTEPPKDEVDGASGEAGEEKAADSAAK